MIVGITGASGFVGQALARRSLREGHEVRCLTRRPGAGLPGATMAEGDLEHPDDRLVRFADSLDVLFHCAGEVADERRMRAVNVDATRALLRAAAGRVGRWVQLSSAGVYGRPQDGVVTEETPVRPGTLYERTKADADALVLDAVRDGLVPSCAILRPTIVFGRGMPNQSVRQWIRMIRARWFFFIGPAGASANYVHVENVAAALLRCGTASPGDRCIYNLSDWCTVEDFAGAIATALGAPPPSLRLPEAPVRGLARLAGGIASVPLTVSRVDALVGRCRYAIDRIERDLGYRHEVTIGEGLADLVAAEAGA